MRSAFKLALLVQLVSLLISGAYASDADQKEALEYFNEGTAALQSGKHSESEKAFQKALALDPTLMQAHLNLAVVLCQQGDYKSGLARFDEAIRLDDSVSAAFNGRGLCKSHLKDYAGAISDFDRAVRLMPSSATYLSNRAVTKMDAGDLDGARKDLEAAAKLNPNDEKVKNNLHLLNSGLENAPIRENIAPTGDPRFNPQPATAKVPGAVRKPERKGARRAGKTAR